MSGFDRQPGIRSDRSADHGPARDQARLGWPDLYETADSDHLMYGFLEIGEQRGLPSVLEVSASTFLTTPRLKGSEESASGETALQTAVSAAVGLTAVPTHDTPGTCNSPAQCSCSRKQR